MKIGISPNYLKPEIFAFVEQFIQKLEIAKIDFVISESVLKIKETTNDFWNGFNLISDENLAINCDVIVSIGGDGTLLQNAYNARNSNTPLLGINFGKLGFLAEFDTSQIDKLIEDLKTENIVIDQRNTLEASCLSETSEKFYAINDIVIERGRYPKMIEISIEIDDEYVSTFSADGIILATPTGSTGYSLSTGGPIVNPLTEGITLSPISAHTLSMRPLVISSKQSVVVKAESQYEAVRVICDGQRVNYLKSPAIIKISKSETSLRLVKNVEKNYFEILRKKLLWGLDLRAKNNGDLL